MTATSSSTSTATRGRPAKSASTLDQATSSVRGAASSARNAAKPFTDKVRSVVKEKPMASALAAGVFGLAILNSFRSRSRTR